jgi:hypothetical protein
MGLFSVSFLRAWVGALSLLAALYVSRPAWSQAARSSAAREKSAQPVLPAHSVNPGYHVKLLAVDAVSLAVMHLGLGLWSSAEGDKPMNDMAHERLAALGVGGALLGGPIVHATEGRWLASFGSLALRLFGPYLTFSLSAGLRTSGCSTSRQEDPETHDASCLQPALSGGLRDALLIGIPISMLLDNLLLAGDRRPSAVDASAPAPPRVFLRAGVRAHSPAPHLYLGGSF